MWATKYRPKTFEEVLGQEAALRVIQGALKSKETSFPRAWLLHGPQGLGKTTLARLMSASLLNTSLDDLVTNPNYFEHNASTCSSVDVLNDILESAQKLPWGEDRFRVYVIDEAHDLSSTAKDRLLSVLEELRGRVVFILLTTELTKLKPTLRSRCLTLSVSKVSLEPLLSRLGSICEQEGVTYDPRALSAIVQASNGHVRDSIMILQQVSLAGGITAESVSEYLCLDSIQSASQVLSAMSANWERIPDMVNRIADQHSPSDIWKVMLDLLVNAYVTKSFPKVGQEIHRQIVGWFGDDLAALGEWCLTYGAKFSVLTVSDLLAGLGYLKQRMRFTASSQAMKKRSSRPTTISRRELKSKFNGPDDLVSEIDILRKLAVEGIDPDDD